MLLPSQAILVAFWTYTSADILITQMKTSLIKTEGNTAFLECQVKTTTHKRNVYLHWYRQKPEQPLQRILYISSNENVVHEQGISEERYEARKFQSELPASLRIHQTKDEDAGLYYYGNTKMRISQDQSFTRRLDKTVHISCKLSGIPLDNAIVHWYEQKEGEPLRRILYGSTKSFKQDNLDPRLETDKKSNGVFYLIINNVIESDGATYYCACWDLTLSQSQKGPVGKPALSHPHSAHMHAAVQSLMPMQSHSMDKKSVERRTHEDKSSLRPPFK